jgi:hypothetical protein
VWFSNYVAIVGAGEGRVMKHKSLKNLVMPVLNRNARLVPGSSRQSSKDLITYA